MDFDFSTIVGGGFFILSAFLTGWLTKIKALLKEVSEALSVLSMAMEDDKLSSEEIKKIMKEFNDIIDIAKKFRK